MFLVEGAAVKRFFGHHCDLKPHECLGSERGSALTETALSVAIVVALLIVAVKYTEEGVLIRASRANSLYGNPGILPPCERPDPPADWSCP